MACIGPVHIALMMLVKKLYGGEKARGFSTEHGFGQAEVWALGVVPGEPAQQLKVEIGELIEEQQVVVIVDELVLDGAIEALAMGVHLRRLRIGTPVRKQQVGVSGQYILH